MYERFTDKARKVMQLANLAAEQRNHERVDTEHILFGLVTDGSGVAAHVLKALGIDLQGVQERIVANLQPRLIGVPTVRPPKTGAAKKAIEYSMEEARNLGHNYIGTEHILLGLLRERDAVAAQVLEDLGAAIEDVRRETVKLLGGSVEGASRNYFHSVGLPSAPTSLVYHQPTSTVVAHVGPHSELPSRKRLFFRWASETRYQPVAALPANISIDSFAVDPSRPSLYFITFEWNMVPGKKAAAGDWDALYRFDLNEHRTERLTGLGDLRPPENYDKTWLKAILSPGNDGRSIFCTAGLMKQGCAEYWICELELVGMRLTPVSQLEAVFA